MIGDVERPAAALQELPVDQREALILVCATGLSYEEAADVCQVAVGTIKSRVYYGLKALRNALEEMGYES